MSTVKTQNEANDSNGNVSDAALAHAADVLRAGKAAVFPTDTVYGLGVAVGPAQSPAELFRIKRRDEGKPVAWLVAGVSDLDVYGKDVPAWAHAAAAAHWPGALTLIVRASNAVPVAFQSAQGTIGLRMPASAVALALIRVVGVPLATTSANISGASAPSKDADLDNELLCQVAAVVRGCDCVGGAGVASTVIDCTKDVPVVLRQGSVVVSMQE